MYSFHSSSSDYLNVFKFSSTDRLTAQPAVQAITQEVYKLAIAVYNYKHAFLPLQNTHQYI